MHEQLKTLITSMNMFVGGNVVALACREKLDKTAIKVHLTLLRNQIDEFLKTL